MYDTTLTFTSGLTAATIYPTCTYNGITLTDPWNIDDQLHSNHTVECHLIGYNNISQVLPTAYPQNVSYTMDPLALNLIFSNLTEGWIDHDENSTYFNLTDLYYSVDDIPVGYVTVRFNPDGAGNWQQILS